MKKLALSLFLSFAIASVTHASATINFALGTMYSSTNNSTTVPVGGLVNILSLDSGSWSGESALFTALISNFTPPGATLVAQFPNDNVSGTTPGVVSSSFVFSYSGNFTAGDELLAVVYPTLTMSSLNPGNNTVGFYFRTAAIIDGSDIAWVAPADGGTYTLMALTTDVGGSLPADQFTSGALATGGQGFTTIPEPSTWALLAGSLTIVMVLRHRRQS
ncbi:MAG: PEP-CTERM sorting domain-containing protein [Verrucomicrobiae bacterium]